MVSRHISTRMKQYELAMLKDDVFDQILGKRFKKLQDENASLRSFASELKKRLDKMEPKKNKVCIFKVIDELSLKSSQSNPMKYYNQQLNPYLIC